MEDWKKDRIGSAVLGKNPLVIYKMRSGQAVIGDTQFLPGYCVLLASPKVDQLHELDDSNRNYFLQDMGLLGEAIQKACNPRRINYSILGNTDPFLHAHIFPRYDWEPEENKPFPVWRYPNVKWKDNKYHYIEEEHGQMKEQIKNKLIEIIERAYKE